MPFVSAIVGAVFGVGTLGAALAQAAIGIGINFVVGKIQQSKAKKSSREASGTQFERDYGENVSRKVACGLVGIAGHDVYVNTYGSSNKNLHQIFVLSDFPCDGLSRVWAGGKQLQLTELSPNNWAVGGDYEGRMSISFFDGTQISAVPILIETANPPGRWTTASVGHGICFVIVSMQYDQERLSGFPDFFFEIRGARLYDPRKDSTIGGFGGHRWGNYGTYEFTENPIIMDYNYRRGFAWGQNGAGDPDVFLGMEMAIGDLPIDRYAAAANICDETVEGETRYRCSIMLDADVDHGDNIDALMSACGGVVVDSVDGSWPLVGTEQPIVATFIDDDLVPGEELTFQRRHSMANLVNSVGGTYPEPANMWSPAGYDTQTAAGYVGLDRRTRDFQLNLNCVPSKRQANQLASIYFNENRYEATAQIVLPPRFQTIAIGDWVRWNSARYGNRVFIVQSRSIRALSSDAPRNVSLSLQERSGEIYAGTGVQPPTIPFPNGEPVYLNELQDWDAIPILAVAGDGRTYPAFRLSWSPIDDVTVLAIDFQWWLKEQPDVVFSRGYGPDVSIGFIQEGILNEERYVFRHKLVANRPTFWSDEIERQSLDGGNGELEVYLANLNREVLDQFKKIFMELDDRRTLLERVMTDLQLGQVSTESMARKLETQTINAKAEFSEEISVVAGELGAVASQVTTLSADYQGNKAQVQNQLVALATADQSLATSITTLNTDYQGNKAQVQNELVAQSTAVSALAQVAQQLTATVNDNSAQGLVKFVVAANQAGVDARFSVAIRGSVGQTFKETGFFLELYNGGASSRFAVLADQFVVTDGASGTLPMVFENGELKLQIANIGTVTTGLLQGNNGKLIINLNAGYMAVYD
jgi:hypothetical protein